MFRQITVNRTITGAGKDLLIQGDGSRPQQIFAELAGTVQVVYIDPPFLTGDQFERRRRFGAQGWRTGSPSPSYTCFSDHYAEREDYLKMLRGLIENAWLLLRQEGMFCLHLDWHASHLARMLCDEIFGADHFVNEIIWTYESGGRSTRHFSRKHDTILLYSRSKDYRFDLKRVPLARTEVRKNHMKRAVDETGRSYRAITVAGKEYRYYDDEPVYPSDVWTDISHIQQRSPERTGYATQKPIALLERLLKPLVDPGDLVVDLCCGSGTTLAAAQALGCRVLGMDLAPEALLITQSRLRSPDLTLQLTCTEDDTPLEGDIDTERGILTLTDLPSEHPAFPKKRQPFDAVERWSLGEIQGDTLRVLTAYQRSPWHYDLEQKCLLPDTLKQPAVATVDAAGAYRVYVWTDDAAGQEKQSPDMDEV